MPNKQPKHRVLDDRKLSEAGMTIFPHNDKNGLQEILRSVQHHSAARLVKRLFAFKHVLVRELAVDFLDENPDSNLENIPENILDNTLDKPEVKALKRPRDVLEQIPENKRYLFVPQVRPHDSTPNKLDTYNTEFLSTLKVGERVCLSAKGIADAARSIATKEEQRWALFMHRFVFEEFHKTVREAEKIMTRRVLTEEELMKDFRIGSEHSWINGKTLLENNRRLRGNREDPQLTCPKPDLYLAYHLHSLSDCPSSENSRVHSDSEISNLSFETLRDLAQRSNLYNDENRRFHPCHLRDYSDKKLPRDQKCRVAFPWLIGEWKHAGVSSGEKQKGIWQAANACAVSLMMLARLASPHPRTQTGNDIRPVFAITSVGSEVSLWVAFIQDFAKGGPLSFEMHRIWHGDLKQQLCAIELCLFLERLHTWALDKLRWWIIECISDWSKTLDIQMSIEAKGTESSNDGNVESAEIGLNGTVMDAKQQEEVEEEEVQAEEQQEMGTKGHETDEDQTESPEPIAVSRPVTDHGSVQDPESVEDSESTGSLDNDIDSDIESSSEYLPGQDNETDDHESHSEFGSDEDYEECGKRGTDPGEILDLHQETGTEEAATSVYTISSDEMETPRPTMHRSKGKSRHKSPDITPSATMANRQYPDSYFSTPPRTPDRRMAPVSDAHETPPLRKENINPLTPVSKFSTPLSLNTNIQKAIMPTRTSNKQDRELSQLPQQMGDLRTRDEPQEKFQSAPEFTFHAPLGSSASTPSTPQISEKAVQHPELPNYTPRTAEALEFEIDLFFNNDIHTGTMLKTNRISDSQCIQARISQNEDDKKEPAKRPPMFIFGSSSSS